MPEQHSLILKMDNVSSHDNSGEVFRLALSFLLADKKKLREFLSKQASENSVYKDKHHEINKESYANWIKNDLKLTHFSDSEISISWEKAQNRLSICEPNKVRILFRSDFGSIRKDLDKDGEMPSHIYYRGTLSPARSITIVGSREVTPLKSKVLSAGLDKNLRSLLEYFPDNKWSIVSGLALGCDTLAHRSALKLGAITIAVLPTSPGANEIYPKENVALADDILKNGGLLISEYPPLTALKKHSFPARNKIQATIGELLVVLEASEKSGTLHTVRAAKKQKKPIYHDQGIEAAGLLKGMGSKPIDLQDANSFKEIVMKLDTSLAASKANPWVPDSES